MVFRFPLRNKIEHIAKSTYSLFLSVCQLFTVKHFKATGLLDCSNRKQVAQRATIAHLMSSKYMDSNQNILNSPQVSKQPIKMETTRISLKGYFKMLKGN